MAAVRKAAAAVATRTGTGGPTHLGRMARGGKTVGGVERSMRTIIGGDIVEALVEGPGNGAHLLPREPGGQTGKYILINAHSHHLHAEIDRESLRDYPTPPVMPPFGMPRPPWPMPPPGPPLPPMVPG